jgi:hypothetical protein
LVLSPTVAGLSTKYAHPALHLMVKALPFFVKVARTVQIELHYTQSTPAVAELRRRTEHVLADLAPYVNVTPVRARTPKPIRTRQATSEATATPGTNSTPVLRIDGHPVLPEEPTQKPGTTSGFAPDTVPSAVPDTIPSTVPGAGALPTEDRIRAHLTETLLKAGPSAIRLPLPHRRIVAIALILMVAGALIGQFFIGGPVLTFTGIALLPIGLATNGRRTGRQPFMLAALIASTLGAAGFAWYFGPLLLNPDGDAAPPSTGFYYAGLVFLAAAWAAAFAALFSRRRLRQHLKDRLLQEITDNPPAIN